MKSDLLFVSAARILTAVLSVAGLALVGVWAGPTALGELTRQLAVSLLVLTAFVQWLKSIIIRHWLSGERALVSILARCWLSVFGVLAVIGCTLAWVYRFDEVAVVGGIASLHVLVVGLHELALEVDRAELRLRSLAVGQAVRGFLGFAALGFLVSVGVDGLYLGLAWPAASCLALVAVQRAGLASLIHGQAASPRSSRSLTGGVIRYGVAAALSATLGTVMVSADRLLIAGLVNIEAAGVYALAYDVGHESTFAIGTVVNQVGFPRLVAIWERRPRVYVALRSLLERLELWMIAGGSVVVLGAVGLGDVIARILAPRGFGAEFASVLGASALLGVALAVKSFVVDVPILLARRNGGLVLSLVAAAACNVALGWPLISRYGIHGAVIASAIAYCIAVIGSQLVSGRVGDRRIRPGPATACRVGLLLGLAIFVVGSDGIHWDLAAALACVLIAGSAVIALRP